MVTFWSSLKTYLGRNKERSRVGTGSIENFRITQSSLGASVGKPNRSMEKIFLKTFSENPNFRSSVEGTKSSLRVNTHSCFKEESNIDPLGREPSDLSIEYIKCIREELEERDSQLRRDILAQFEEIQVIKKYLDSNDAKHKETKERLDVNDKKRKEMMENTKLQHQEARRRLERLEDKTNLKYFRNFT